MSTLTISIDRTGMVGDPDPLVLIAHDDEGETVLGVTGYSEPARQVRNRYAPPSDFAHGQVPLGFTYQQSLLTFEVVPFDATETQGKAAVLELEAAVARLSYEVTVTVNGAPTYTWTCTAGSVLPVGARSYVDLKYANPSWAVSLPCHPVPEIGA